MKKEYEKPIIDIEKLEVEDIITESGTGKLGKTLPGYENDDNFFNA